MSCYRVLFRTLQYLLYVLLNSFIYELYLYVTQQYDDLTKFVFLIIINFLNNTLKIVLIYIFYYN